MAAVGSAGRTHPPALQGKCRFIVVNAQSGGILEAVEDFGAAPLRYSEPRGIVLPLPHASVQLLVLVCLGPMRGGGWHKALVVGSVSLWRRLLASRP